MRYVHEKILYILCIISDSADNNRLENIDTEYKKTIFKMYILLDKLD